MQCCQEVLNTLSLVDSGYTAWRGKMLHELTRTKVHVAKMDFSQGKINKKALQQVFAEEKMLQVYFGYYQSIFFPSPQKKK